MSVQTKGKIRMISPVLMEFLLLQMLLSYTAKGFSLLPMKAFLKNKYFAGNIIKLSRITGILKALSRAVSHSATS